MDEHKESITPSQPQGRTAGPSLSLDEFIILTEEIAGMARAGLPLDRGLTVLAREMGRGQLRRVTTSIAEDLKAGSTLPDALQRQTGRVPAFYARLMAAGIRAGKLSDVLSTLTMYARVLADLRSAVLSALFYPMVVLVLALSLITGLTYFLVPQFEQIFESFRMRVPDVTRVVIFMSHHVLEIFVIPGVVLVFLTVFLWRILGRTREGRRKRTWLLYRIPLVGTMIRAARLAAFTDLLGILVDNGVPLPEAFSLAGEASADPLVAGGSEQVCQTLNQGRPLGEALRLATMVPEVVAWMIGIGERRGTLGTTLHQVADMYRRQVEMRANLLRSILPPFLIIVVAGIIVLLFIFALMFPMVSLLEGLGGGHMR